MANLSGYPNSQHWNVDSRPLSEATNVLRSFVVQNIIQDNQWEIDRITKYYLYWKFYEGLHYKDFNDGMLSFNYVQAFIDKVSMYLLGDKAFNFQVESYYTTQVDKEVEKALEELIMYHWNKSDKLNLAYEILQMGSVTGDAWVGAEWDEEEKFCRVKIYDSRQCFCIFKEGDINKLSSFMVRQTLDHKSSKYRLFVTKMTNDKIETWYQKDVAIAEGTYSKYEVKTIKNPYGIIPVVHIKNRPNSSGYYGKSDANNILKINKIYNELNQQIKAIIDYHVTPTTVITGASAKSLKRGLGTIWSGLPPEANVFNLGLDVDLSATINYAKDLKMAMHELSDVPENALGKVQAISNTSAAALQITYLPLVQQANLKAITYGEGIRKINNLILRITKVEDPDNKRLKVVEEIEPDYLTDLKVVPVFCFGFPKDKMDELQRAQMELQMRVGSKQEVMQRMGKQNIPDLMEEIAAETFEDAVLQARIETEVASMYRNMGMNPNMPNEEGNMEEGVLTEGEEGNMEEGVLTEGEEGVSPEAPDDIPVEE